MSFITWFHRCTRGFDVPKYDPDKDDCKTEPATDEAKCDRAWDQYKYKWDGQGAVYAILRLTDSGVEWAQEYTFKSVERTWSPITYRDWASPFFPTKQLAYEAAREQIEKGNQNNLIVVAVENTNGKFIRSVEVVDV